MRKKLINVAIILLWQQHMVFGSPGIVDSPEIRKRAISTKLSTYNAIGSGDSSEKQVSSSFETTENPSSSADFEPMKITHDDVMTSGDSVYGARPPFINGGIIFAIGQGVSSTPLMSAAHPQPVLLQYLSPEGMPQQTAMQYVQILRPLMVVPAQPYHPSKSITMDIQTESTPTVPTSNAYRSYTSSALVGAHSAPQTYIQASSQSFSPKPESDMSLNMNEYVPSASSRISTSVLLPHVTNNREVKPISKYSMMAQRA